MSSDMTNAEAQELVRDVKEGDQAWRKTIHVRYAKFLLWRAEQAMLENFAARHELGYRIAIERESAMSDAYGVGAIPQIVLIDRAVCLGQRLLLRGRARLCRCGGWQCFGGHGCSCGCGI